MQLPQTKISPKVTQFLEELNMLQDKYQYNLVLQLKYTKNGIVPEMVVQDKIPVKTEPKKEEKK